MGFFEDKYFYFIVLFIAAIYPLLQSFERRLKFYRTWIYLLPSLFVMMIIHIPIDIFFTKIGIWEFNNELIYGSFILNLPIEEWLFFIIIPFACLFIYRVLKYFFTIPKPSKEIYRITFFFGIILILIALYFYNNTYTTVYFGMLGLSLVIINFVKPSWWSDFLFMYAVSLIPFLLINGLLTGSFTNHAVVIYNEAEIIGLRILNIPLEDTIYSFVILLNTVWCYEYFKKKFPCLL